MKEASVMFALGNASMKALIADFFQNLTLRFQGYNLDACLSEFEMLSHMLIEFYLASKYRHMQL